MQRRVRWPDGKRFAFTVFDDTDNTNLTSGPDVYTLLMNLGMRTTKSVWTIDSAESTAIGGSTCQDPEYLAWAKELQSSGFEIALHGVANGSSSRDDTLHGLEMFKQWFGHYPYSHVNHNVNRDSLYWGASRLTGANRLLYRILTLDRTRGQDGGSNASSHHFWGDAAQSKVTYVRNFVFSDINTLRQCPQMPYHDSMRPLVNYWFASSDGGDCETFCRTISEDNQDRLEEEGGACIMYTHFGTAGFRPNGQLDERFTHLMKRLAAKDGWFAPVRDVLDHLRRERGDRVVTPIERRRLERKWLFEKIFISRGTS